MWASDGRDTRSCRVRRRQELSCQTPLFVENFGWLVLLARPIEAEAQIRVAGDPGVGILRSGTHGGDSIDEAVSELELSRLPKLQRFGDTAVVIAKPLIEHPRI